MERKNLWQTYSEAQIRELEEVNAQYRTCLDEGKTERECVKKTIELAEAEGYRNMKDLIKAGTKIHAGDKVYMDYMGKAIVLFQAGTAPVEEGMNILGAHIDSPRIDVKQNPLYENEGLAYLDTHYYGGVKKYQWLSIPLALHGVIVKKNGEKVEVCVGEKETDPVLVINDLLPHLGARQREKLAKDFIDGEQMDLLIGNRPEDKEENAVAEYVLLNEGVEYNDIVLRRTLANSKMLSSDVSAGFDPMYEDVYEKRNAAFLARGPVFNKYTGSGGKSGSNDANPEYIAQLRQIMEEAGVNFQTAELGRVDVGGGGTIAYLMSVYGMEVIDSGVAVLGMHAPWETTSKADVYEAVRCYEAFLKAEF